MEYEKIKQIIDDMGNSKLTELEIEFPDGTKIKVKKDAITEKVIVNESVEKIENKSIETISTPEQKKEEGKIVKSPMVGTFYIKPSPTSEAYVKVGDEVKQGDTLCIIEAMKLMNEIESEYTGKIAEILVSDGAIVEYGTPLFRLEQ